MADITWSDPHTGSDVIFPYRPTVGAAFVFLDGTSTSPEFSSWDTTNITIIDA